MSTQEDREVVLTDSGWMVRIFGVAALLGSLGFSRANMPGIGAPIFSLAGWLFVIVGLVMVLFASDLTVSVDRSMRMLRLDDRYLWLFRVTREIPFDEISDIRVKTTSSYSSGHTGYTYRLEAVLTNGKTVRFRWYSTGDGRVKKTTGHAFAQRAGAGAHTQARRGGRERRRG